LRLNVISEAFISVIKSKIRVKSHKITIVASQRIKQNGLFLDGNYLEKGFDQINPCILEIQKFFSQDKSFKYFISNSQAHLSEIGESYTKVLIRESSDPIPNRCIIFESIDMVDLS